MSDRTIKQVLALNLITLTLALAGTVVAIVSIEDAVAARTNARRDTCHLIKGLAYAATSNSPKARLAASKYVDRTPLRDCDVYAKTNK